MKKRVLIYIAAVTTFFSMQSCVSNYTAVAAHSPEYKTDAKAAALDTKQLEDNKNALLKSFQTEIKAVAAASEAAKNAEIERAIKHSKTIDGLLSEAESYLGTPYRFGGMTRNGIDCSAFVLSVFGAATGTALPRIAAAQAQQGETISRENLSKGDLLFFSQGGGRISHVAIVYDITPEGIVRFIHAATSKGVSISSLSDSYWASKFRFAKRILNDKNPNFAQN